MLKQLEKAPALDWRSIDHVVAMPLGSWRAAQAMHHARGDRSGSRMAYAEGVLEIMSPSWRHEFIKKNIARLLESWALKMNIEKLPIYAALGVKEVWVWDRGAISAHVLRGTTFVRSARSTLLPSLDLERLAKYASLEDQSKAVRAFLKLKGT